jgi:oligopeptide/dipeptide ABC transporter ATP-binding protein
VTAPLLVIDGLTTTFPAESGRAPVVDEVGLGVERGEVVALVGESGCGKSMTAMSILRLVPRPGRIDKGEIRLDGRDIMGLSVPEMRRIRGAEISMIFQEPMTSLNPVFQAGEQVIEAIRLHEKLNRTDARARTLELFRQVGIPDPEARLSAYPHQLSGGIRQRVMIAMALATRPKLLIADEPTTALDVTIQAQILKLLSELRESLGMSVLLITHDLGVVNELAHRVAVMYAGKIVEQGTREQVLGEPAHPYTRGLLGSMPGLAARGKRLAEIPGVVPSPGEWPPGCRFSTRCPLAFEPCSDQAPGSTTVLENHLVWCHAVEKEKGS